MQNKVSAATAAANARCNVRITLLPKVFGLTGTMRTPCQRAVESSH
jgi:hypothetical protein